MADLDFGFFIKTFIELYLTNVWFQYVLIAFAVWSVCNIILGIIRG